MHVKIVHTNKYQKLNKILLVQLSNTIVNPEKSYSVNYTTVNKLHKENANEMKYFKYKQ